MIDFPSPILSVSTDVVKDLDGEDALYGMWTVFTKCKQSLKDGRRLENISWRLWYREMASSHPNDSHSSGSSSPAASDGRCPSPMTPLSEDGPQGDANSLRGSLMPTPDPSNRHSWHGDDHLPPSTVRRLSTASMPVRPRSHPPQRLGSIILDILPSRWVVPAPPHKTRSGSGTSASKCVVPVLSHPGTAKPSPVAQGTASTGSSLHSTFPAIVRPRAVLAVPTLNLPATPLSQSGGAPRVVVVNPTPHPTPPATPHPSHTSAAQPAPAPTHLTPPPVRPAPAVTVLPRAAPARSKQDGTVAVPSEASLISSPPPSLLSLALRQREHLASTATTSRKGGDETLKASDRRFFLEAAESPDQDSPERGGLAAAAAAGNCKSPDVPEPSPSSGTSSHVKSEGMHPVRRTVSKPGSRRGKDLARFTAVRSSTKLHTQRQLTAHHRKPAAEPKKTTFNIGSVSSNGTRSDSKEQREPSQKPSSSKQNQQPPPKARQAAVHKSGAAPVKKGLVLSTSSEYTTDSDDSEWASEDNSAEDAKEKERQKEETRLKEAAEEAQRQRDMFAKVDRRSYTQLNRARSGLLTQLLNPDPTIFPPDHPYRVKSLTDMTRLTRRAQPPNLATSKSSAAIPLTTQITPLTAQAPPTDESASKGYRPKGRPQGQELEDESESEDEGDNGIQLSRSLAQQKLAALAGPGRRRASEQAVPLTRQQQGGVSMSRPTLPTVATAPIPLAHPYNLPAPAPPMTPRTTRRQMLSTELSESLRRNLLWERQVSKMNMLGGARRTGLLSQQLRPLTAMNPAQQQQQQQQPRQQQQSHHQQNVDEREERRRAAIARNRSWADDYHCSGW